MRDSAPAVPVSPDTGREAMAAATSVILQVQDGHRMASAGIAHGRDPEHWRCRCGEHYRGEEALIQGRHHVATQIAAALSRSPERATAGEGRLLRQAAGTLPDIVDGVPLPSWVRPLLREWAERWPLEDAAAAPAVPERATAGEAEYGAHRDVFHNGHTCPFDTSEQCFEEIWAAIPEPVPVVLGVGDAPDGDLRRRVEAETNREIDAPAYTSVEARIAWADGYTAACDRVRAALDPS